MWHTLTNTRYLVYNRLSFDPHSYRQTPIGSWTRQMLYVLKKMDIGWASQIDKKLAEYDLETWDNITRESKSNWKNNETTATEKIEIRALLRLHQNLPIGYSFDQLRNFNPQLWALKKIMGMPITTPTLKCTSGNRPLSFSKER